MPFLLSAKNVFLTYPQIPEETTARDGLDALLARFADRCSFAVVSREQHADGGDHLHALLSFQVSVVYSNV